MRMPYVLVTSIFTLATGVATLAPTALAGSYSPTCSAASTTVIDGSSQTFTIRGSCTSFSWGHGGSTSTSDYTVTLDGNPVTRDTVTSAPSGSTVVLTYSGPSGVLGRANIIFNPGPGQEVYLINVGTGGGGSSSDSSSAPTPVMQQFGKPASSTCDAVAPESLNWSGVESGGWGESWAEWMNGGNGGAVCTRTLIYSTAQSRWIVG